MEKIPFRIRKKYVLGDIDATLRVLDTEKRPYASLHSFSEMYKVISDRDLQDDLRLSNLNLTSISEHMEHKYSDNIKLIPGDDYGITPTKFVFKRHQNAEVDLTDDCNEQIGSAIEREVLRDVNSISEHASRFGVNHTSEPNTQSDDMISFEDRAESLQREIVTECEDLGMPAIDLAEYGLADLAIDALTHDYGFMSNSIASTNCTSRKGEKNDSVTLYDIHMNKRSESLGGGKQEKQNDTCSLSSTNREDKMQFYRLASGHIMNYERAFEQRRNIVTKTVNQLKNIFRHSTWSNIENMCEVIETLRLLHRRYPHGCNAIQLCDFEEDLRKGKFHKELGKVRNIPAFSSLMDIGNQSFQMLVYVDGRYQVSADVLDVSFIRLRKNLCSNLYRLLQRLGGRAKMCEIENSLMNLVPRGINIGVENVIELCNRYPLLFNFIAQNRNNYEVKSAVVELNKSIPDWIVRLDAEFTAMEGSICSCAKCRSTLTERN
ncbi:hypothetical protein Ddc_18224 [Ditylenchus destructor]|nr:hypothetical protein Ddc_18224 [Ditylenchus destructor]